MHFLAALPLAAGLVAALPAGQATDASLQSRQFGGGGGSTRDDLQEGGTCPKVILVYARATGERGNLGILGGVIGSALESEYGQGNVWVQGVGGAYDAGIAGNMQRDGAAPAAIAEMVGLFDQAAQKCPEATIVTGGYSQGSALTAAAVRDVSPDVRSKIAGAVLFGYTKVCFRRPMAPRPVHVLTFLSRTLRTTAASLTTPTRTSRSFATKATWFAPAALSLPHRTLPTRARPVVRLPSS